jgi:hypothetical protein
VVLCGNDEGEVDACRELTCAVLAGWMDTKARTRKQRTALDDVAGEADVEPGDGELKSTSRGRVARRPCKVGTHGGG